jgi:HSP20 family protein
MANNRPNTEQQGQQASTATQTSTTAESGRQAGGVQGTDRERAIRTDRESAPGRAVSTRRGGQGTTVYGPSSSSPFGLMRRMAEDMDRILEDFGFGPTLATSPLFSPSLSPTFGGSALQSRNWAPQVETFRRGDNLVIRADLPGLRKEDVNVEVDDGVLSISGERSEEQVDDRDDYYRSERSYGRFYRALPLPEGANAENTEATFKDGVLEVTLPLPKQPERKARQIQVK